MTGDTDIVIPCAACGGKGWNPPPGMTRDQVRDELELRRRQRTFVAGGYTAERDGHRYAAGTRVEILEAPGTEPPEPGSWRLAPEFRFGRVVAFARDPRNPLSYGPPPYYLVCRNGNSTETLSESRLRELAPS